MPQQVRASKRSSGRLRPGQSEGERRIFAPSPEPAFFKALSGKTIVATHPNRSRQTHRSLIKSHQSIFSTAW